MTHFEFRFFEDDGTTPRTLDPEAAETVRAALESLARAVARNVGMTHSHPTVTVRQEPTSQPEGNPEQ